MGPVSGGWFAVGVAADALRAARTGERWVVRVRQADGSATDVIGWIAGISDDTMRVELPVDPLATGAPEVWAAPLTDVVAARRAPDARGGPGPRRTSAAALEQLAVEAWAVDLEPLGEWTLRSGGGFTGRANSCLAVGDPGIPVAEAAGRVEAYAVAHDIAPMAQVVDGSGEEVALRDLGWVDTYVVTDVLAVRLVDLLAGTDPGPRVVVGETLTPTWRSAYDESRPSSADPTVVTRLLDGRPPRAYASVQLDGQVAALGRGHLSVGWLQIAGVWTRPEQRRRGLGTAVLLGLARWAARRDARWCHLQVETENGPAHATYERLGFALHHRYRYLAPAGPQPPHLS